MKRLKTGWKHYLHHQKSRIQTNLKHPWEQDQNEKNSAQTATAPSPFCTAVEVRVVRLGYLGVKHVSRRLSRGLVAITSTAAPGRRTGDKSKIYDKTDFCSDEMGYWVVSIVTVVLLTSL